MSNRAGLFTARDEGQLEKTLRDLSEDGYRIVSVLLSPAQHYLIIA